MCTTPPVSPSPRPSTDRPSFLEEENCDVSRRGRDTPTTHLSSLFPKTFASSYGCRARSSLRNPLPSLLLFSLFQLRCVSRGQVTTKCFLRYRLPPITDGPPLLSFVLAREIHLPSRRPNSHSPLSIGPEGWKGRENANNACLPTEEWVQSGKDGGWTDGGGRFSSVPTPITSEHILSIKSSWHVLT